MWARDAPTQYSYEVKYHDQRTARPGAARLPQRRHYPTDIGLARVLHQDGGESVEFGILVWPIYMLAWSG